MDVAAAQIRIAKLEKANRCLRRQVAIARQRQAHFEQRSQTLETTLQALQAAQSKLVAAEKMSALGTMVAGVAHEINNPITFIHGNLAHISLYTQDLLHLVQIYQREFPKTSADLQIAIAAIDLPFLEQDLKKILQSVWSGTERIRKIVESLRTFARLDEAVCKIIDIHESLDSTLLIVRNRFRETKYRSAIELVCDYDYDNLPPIECYGGAINQVFLQLLNNAIDAIDDQAVRQSDSQFDSQSHPNRLNRIQIQTRYSQLPNCITISISDNGCGIPNSVANQIFDPFFTTKPIGHGTGLGLSTSYQTIVAQHHGQLYCRSGVGEGSEFVIVLPLSGSCDLVNVGEMR
jgi:two-component system, NtrC family, sensor kinase